jgi:acetyl-CoA C-acetyltransferase
MEGTQGLAHNTPILVGAEAGHNQRSAERAGQTLDWAETFDNPVEDRGWGKIFVTEQEFANGLYAPIYYFALIEQARAHASGLPLPDYRTHMAALLSSINQVATRNPYAQFPAALTTNEILAATPLNHLYSKRMIARDTVNQGADVQRPARPGTGYSCMARARVKMSI